MEEKLEIKELLEKWDLVELIPIFEEHGIETGTIKDLSPELIKELIPKIGIRAKFLKNIENYSNSQKLETSNVLEIGINGSQMIDLNDSILASLNPLDSSDIEICTSSSSSISSGDNLTMPSMPSQHSTQVLSTVDLVNTPLPNNNNNMKTVKETGLKDLLISTTRGKLIMFSYKKNGRLLSEFRDKLVDLMLDAELEKYLDTKVSILRFEEMAAAIVALFPSECREVYFRKTRKRSGGYVGGGKLFSKYYNLRKQLKLNGLINNKKSDSDDELLTGQYKEPG